MLRFPFEPPQQPSPRQPGMLRSAFGLIFFIFGSLLTQTGRVFVELGQFWGGRQMRIRLARAVAYFYGTTPEQSAAPSQTGHQQSLVRFGSAIILSIVSIWALMWIVMLLGAPLAWLALNGYGAWLLLGCIVLGTIIGCWLAYLHSRSTQRSNLN